VVIDKEGKLVTGQNPASSEAVADAVIKLLSRRAGAAEIRIKYARVTRKFGTILIMNRQSAATCFAACLFLFQLPFPQ
jgi:hypothetical protein